MKRVYNEKISPRANESLTRREHTVQTQKRVIVLVCVLVIFAVILIGNSIITFAGSRAEQPVHKYYASVQLQREILCGLLPINMLPLTVPPVRSLSMRCAN
ncbi:MAG: hypothetical protein ACLROW_03940 [Roseburia faecis]